MSKSYSPTIHSSHLLPWIMIGHSPPSFPSGIQPMFIWSYCALSSIILGGSPLGLLQLGLSSPLIHSVSERLLNNYMD